MYAIVIDKHDRQLKRIMKPILFNLPMPIQTERLLIRSHELGDGSIINRAIVESYDD